MTNTFYNTVPLSAKTILCFYIEHCTNTNMLTLANISLILKLTSIAIHEHVLIMPWISSTKTHTYM